MDSLNDHRKASREIQAAWPKASRVAAEMDCSVRTVKRWIAESKVVGIQTTPPTGEWRISRDSLDAWVDSLRSRCSARPDRTTFDCDHPAADPYEVKCPICGALRTDQEAAL